MKLIYLAAFKASELCFWTGNPGGIHFENLRKFQILWKSSFDCCETTPNKVKMKNPLHDIVETPATALAEKQGCQMSVGQGLVLDCF